MEKWAVIVAGGSGTRMGADTLKQFMLLAGKPVLMHTLEKFEGCHIIVVLPAEQIQYWRGLCRAHGCKVEHRTVAGGDSRQESVLCGLRLVPDEAVVAVHDGVRPLASRSLIDRCFAEAEQQGCAIAAVECTDSLRCDGKAVDRSRYLLMQTPQTFRASQLKDAYSRYAADTDMPLSRFTDDASIYEAAGGSLHFVKGERGNIKITLPVDLRIAEALV